MSQSPSKDFSYLKDWLAHPDPVPVVLECIPSRTGASISVYDREERLFTVHGWGFDRIGTALARFLMNAFHAELLAFAKTAKREVNGQCGYHKLACFSGFEFHPSKDGHGGESVFLDGATGISCMIRVAEALGLSVRNTLSKSGTLLIITRRESKS